MAPTAQPPKLDRSFLLFLALMLVVAVLTVVAFIVFGPPEISTLRPD